MSKFSTSSSGRRLYKITETPPLLLIDDLGISLDAGRRKKLLSQLQEMGQVFVTSTEKPSEEVTHSYLQTKLFLVEAAVITPYSESKNESHYEESSC